MQEAVVLIPSLQPGKGLTDLIRDLHDEGFYRIIVIDDGSPASCLDHFGQAEKLHAHVVHHEKNLGKGEAIKSGIRKAVELYGSSNTYITVDCDGQHKARDVGRLANKAMLYPDRLILGVRDFDSADVPVRSLIGNKAMSLAFRLSTGISCPDTQTGLRLIPADLEQLALETEGSRYEYEMNFLEEAVGKSAIEFVPIETIYENNNAGSHFRMIRDSLGICKKFIRFGLSSVLSMLLDFVLFYLFWNVLKINPVSRSFISTIFARCLSGAFNFTLNRFWAFKSGRADTANSLVRYILVWLGNMITSALFTSILAPVMPVLAAKVLVDGTLFIASYFLQKNWVFKRKVAV